MTLVNVTSTVAANDATSPRKARHDRRWSSGPGEHATHGAQSVVAGAPPT